MEDKEFNDFAQQCLTKIEEDSMPKDLNSKSLISNLNPLPKDEEGDKIVRLFTQKCLEDIKKIEANKWINVDDYDDDEIISDKEEETKEETKEETEKEIIT